MTKKKAKQGRPAVVQRGAYLHIMVDARTNKQLDHLSAQTGASKAHHVRQALGAYLPTKA